ncbi:MAG: dCTP deaminase domain-containing protein, partial [Gaiellales bacterium]
GKSSLGRLGLLFHSTAGFIDAGWDGHVSLEHLEENVAAAALELTDAEFTELSRAAGAVI